MYGRFVVETRYKKYKRMDGYQCNGHGAVSVLLHLVQKFRRKDGTGYYSEYELKKAYRQGKIRIVSTGEAI
jgi:hypothetical protein